MICSSGIGFDPVLDGVRLRFGFEGIWQGTAVLYERQSGSLWMHLTGECFHGAHAGRRLAPLATGRHTTFAEWRAAHPDTEVMASDPRFERRYFDRRGCQRGDTYLPPDFGPTIQSRDPRLDLADLLLGVRTDGQARAYPLKHLTGRAGVVADRVGRVPVTVWLVEAGGGQPAAVAFDARLDGRTLEFERLEGARFRARGDGSVFDAEGRCVSGPLAGRRLERPDSLLCEWYGWFAHHPATSIWTP